jgi:hypothetical protein
MLVIAMSAVVGKPPGPGLTKFASEWFKHGIPNPQGPLVLERPERLALIPLLDHYIYPDKARVARIQHRDALDHYRPGPVAGRTGQHRAPGRLSL